MGAALAIVEHGVPVPLAGRVGQNEALAGFRFMRSDPVRIALLLSDLAQSIAVLPACSHRRGKHPQQQPPHQAPLAHRELSPT
jgi:hypothetical protein